MNNKKIFCLGDSWGVGAELNFSKGEKPFAKLLADEFSYDLNNSSQNNLSLGLITRLLAQKAPEICKDDVVLVVIPPDSRWYTEWKTINYEKSSNFFYDKTNAWFQYHHQMFIFTICEILNKIGCRYVLMHNYGEFPLNDIGYYFSNYHADKFLGKESLTQTLTNADSDILTPIEVETNQNNIFKGVYFEGNAYHPNQRGHIKIAELIKSKLKF